MLLLFYQKNPVHNGRGCGMIKCMILKGCAALKPLRAIWHYIRHTDLYLVFVALCCSAFSLVLISSATHAYDTNKYLVVQSAAVCIGLIAFVIASLFDFENFAPYWKWVFVLNLVFQASVFVLGTASGGNKSWIVLGPISLQPAEVGKILFSFTLAAHVAQVRDQLNRMKTVVFLALHLLLTMGVIVAASKDMGSAIAYFAIFVIALFAAGISLKWFAGGAVLALVAVPVIWNLLKDYQRNRILVLLDPAIDPTLAYQTTQSKIAIGAGQMYGQGYLQGNQTQYGMLPAKHTDFIFGVAGEEFGFIGCCLIVALLMLLILRLGYIAFKADTPFSSVFVVGLAGMFLFQMLENIFMCIGLFPVMGLTLPLFSYGGSSVVTMYAALGIAAGVRMREKPSWLRQ